MVQWTTYVKYYQCLTVTATNWQSENLSDIKLKFQGHTKSLPVEQLDSPCTTSY